MYISSFSINYYIHRSTFLITHSMFKGFAITHSMFKFFTNNISYIINYWPNYRVENKYWIDRGVVHYFAN